MPHDCTCRPGNTTLCPRCAGFLARALGIAVPLPPQMAPRGSQPAVPLAQEEETMLRLVLPWPDSANHHWAVAGSRLVLSAAGKRYRRAIGEAMLVLWPRNLPRPLTRRLHLTIVTHAATRRRYDLDNLLKALLDALTHAGVWEDDSQIDAICIQRGAVTRDAGSYLCLAIGAE